ncbi:MAG TPA: TlyA family RNA methyltransferase [Myxococcota bacterium]|nr:TlyA family RNA methyltransferase [Myxococcota bacterium]
MAARRVRLDQRLVELGLETTRARAQLRIQAGEVRLGDRVVDKPATLVDADAVPSLAARSRFVSRGGEKLAGALDALALDPAGLRCADVGASTGGFTDCLLQRGAASVFALDVGRGQLDAKLRADPRVESLERTNVRHFELPAGRAPYDLVTADVSFISLRTVLPRLRALVRPGGRLLVLVKPQFELERRSAPKGVVRDPELRARAVRGVREAAEGLALLALGEAESALPGPKGNREVFLLLQRPSCDAESPPAAGGDLPGGKARLD